MTVDATKRKRSAYREAGLRTCPKCRSEQACWGSAKDSPPVSLICQHCGSTWPDKEETEKAKREMWAREEREKYAK